MSLPQRLSESLQSGEEFFSAADRPTGVSTWHAFQTTKLYDLLAATPVIAWFAFCIRSDFAGVRDQVLRATPDTIDFQFIVFLLAQMASILFVFVVLALLILRRPAKAKAGGLLPRLFACAGGYLGVGIILLPRHELGIALSTVSLLLIFGGLGFSLFAILHLGRSFSVMAEARRLVTDGPYATVRHPLYLGEAISMLGLVLQYVSPFAILIALLQFAFQLMRMKNEERVLSGMFPNYGAYAAHTSRLIPGIY